MVGADASVLGRRPAGFAVVPDGGDPPVSPRLVGRYAVEAAPPAPLLAGPVLARAAGDRHSVSGWRARPRLSVGLAQIEWAESGNGNRRSVEQASLLCSCVWPLTIEHIMNMLKVHTSNHILALKP